MRAAANLDELKKLPHLDLSDLRGRMIPLQSLFENDRWTQWIPKPDGTLLELHGETVEAVYFAKSAAKPSHLFFPFIHFAYQRVYWPHIAFLVEGIYSDTQNLAASMEKIRLIFDHRIDHHSGDARMVATEIEYIFLTCRSIFDLLQEIIATLWESVKLVDTSVKKRALPKSYREMLYHGGSVQTSEGIHSKYGVPVEMGEAYVASEPFFGWMRSYRDLIAHSGRSLTYIFRTDEGFSVSRSEKPFGQMEIWCEANCLPNDLGSALSAIAYVINTTLETCNSHAEGIEKGVHWPTPLAPGHRVFLAGENLGHLTGVANLIRARPWYVTPKWSGGATASL